MSRIDYEITWIDVTKLSVLWREAQRPFNEKWARQIAEEFDNEKFEPIIVTKPNGAGIYHIIEGQHRKSALEYALGENQKAPCRVIGEADPHRAAEIWVGVNKGRKTPRPIQEFLVCVEAQRSTEVAINRIVRRVGFHVSAITGDPYSVKAVGALRRVYATYGAQTLMHVLEACKLMWGDEPQGVSGRIISGLALFINEFHAYVDPERMRSVIVNQYKSPWKFIDAAKVEAEKSSETLDTAMSELVRMKYNKGLHENKKLRRKEA